jgi:hypothetical protein
MNNYTKSQKGQKGFIKKYKALGELKQIKIPESLEKDIKTVLDLLEIIARKENGEKTVNTIMKNMITDLQNLA